MPGQSRRVDNPPRFYYLARRAALVAALFAALGVAAEAAAQAGHDSPAEPAMSAGARFSTAQHGSKLKWLPYRPSKRPADQPIVAAQYVFPVASAPAAPANPPRSAAAALADPFGDGPLRPTPAAPAKRPDRAVQAPAVIGPADGPRHLQKTPPDEMPQEPQEVAGVPGVLPDFPAAAPSAAANARPQPLAAALGPAEAIDKTAEAQPPPVEPTAEPPRSAPAPTAIAPQDTTAEPGAGQTIPHNLGTNHNGATSPSIEESIKAGPAEIMPKCPSPDDEEYFKPIDRLSIDTSVKGDKEKKESERMFPPDCSLGAGTFQPRSFASTTFTWKASGLCHKPLYFEDVALERYGHSWGPLVQPVISGAHFFLVVPALPYAMGLCPPCECQYSLGYYRPGSCAPYLLDPLPLSVRAALIEGGVWTGLVFLIP